MPFFKYAKTKKRRKRYNKISPKLRIFLFKMVFCDGSGIKEVPGS